MFEKHVNRIIFNDMPRQIDPEKPLFTIGAVADILGIKPRMLRFYEERGLIELHALMEIADCIHFGISMCSPMFNT